MKIKEQFLAEKENLFNDRDLVMDSYKFCVRYSILVEEYVYRVLGTVDKNFVIASAGSFSRRELSPFSDIDLMFILPEIAGNEELIQEYVTKLWDAGIEASHTVREFSDVERFLHDDLHAYTQFFETRFLIGNKSIYSQWNKLILGSITPQYKNDLTYEFIKDIEERHKKHGSSPKVLEPNLKFTAGGLRDLHAVEWMYSLNNNILLTNQSEITQTESFLNNLAEECVVHKGEIKRLLESYKFVLNVRNLLHLYKKHKTDRLEFSDQEAIAKTLNYTSSDWIDFMHRYFECTSIINRFTKTMIKRFLEQISSPLSEYLTIELDDDFSIKGKVISTTIEDELSISEIMRAFYYRGLYGARFNENLRSLIIESAQGIDENELLEKKSSVFFREILKLPQNVGRTMSVMNELGVLSAFIPEFKDLVGFFQPGVYHCYTADEHTLIALNNLEKIFENDSRLSKIYEGIKNKDILFLAVLLHDIAKPHSISGHEIIGAEIASTVMERIGYEENEIELVQFLVRNHLRMEQVAFRRNLNDAATLNSFTSVFPSIASLELLYLVTYADLSAVSPVVWTKWKSDLLNELYRKTKAMLNEKLSGEELLYSDAMEAFNGTSLVENKSVISHVESINDIGYLQHFTEEEIEDHVKEIARGSKLAVYFKEDNGFTVITIVTRDSSSLLSRLCGAIAVNDLNIHDARIFTRKDGIIIDSFTTSDFRSKKLVDKERYSKIKKDIELAVENELQINKEFSKIKSKWWRIESKLFKRKGKVKILFEPHDKYTIIDIYSPDRLGLLYQITKKINELDLSVFYAKIATKSDDVVDSFYTLDRNGNKISENDYELIRHELTKTIEEML